MILRVPSYYRKFQCIAEQCKNSCCIGWEIDIDEETFSYYKSVGGKFGERLRSHMKREECNSFMLEENGWCPFLNEKKLCDICIELGAEALCEVCTEFPRFTMEYKNVREKVLSLSCEEVGRLIFSTDEKIRWEEIEISDEYEEMSEDDAEQIENNRCKEGEEQMASSVLERVRAHAVEILQNRSMHVFDRAAEYLLYCEKMQQELYGYHGKAAVEDKEREDFQKTDSKRGKKSTYQDFLARMQVYERLEVLDETWTDVKKALFREFSEENYQKMQHAFAEAFREREYEYEHLLVYFTNRYFMRAYYDANIVNKAKFAVVSVLMIRDMDVLRYLQNGGKFTLYDRIDTARIYSKEVEHSEENIELLADDLQFEEIFEQKRLLEQLQC